MFIVWDFWLFWYFISTTILYLYIIHISFLAKKKYQTPILFYDYHQICLVHILLKSGTTTTQLIYDTKDKDPFIIIVCVWVCFLKHFKTNLSIITASTSQYAHYVFMAIDRDANGSVSFEV